MHLGPKPLLPAPAAAVDWQIVSDRTVTAGWHPYLRALMFHWQKHRRMDLESGRPLLPSRQAVDPAGLHGILPWMWMLDIHRDPAQPHSWRFRYRLAGTRFVDLLGREVTQRWYDEVRPQAYAANRGRLLAVARTGVATWRRGPMPLESGAWQQTENLMLPLAADGVTPDIVLGITVRYDSAGAALV